MSKPSSSPWSWARWAWAGLAVGALLAVASWAASMRHGHSLYWFVDLAEGQRFGRGAATLLSGMLLFSGGLLTAAGGSAWARLGERRARTWMVAGGGLVWLALDEVLMLHEAADAMLESRGVPRPGPFDWDVYVFGTYGLVAAVLAWRLFPSLRRHDGARRAAIAMATCFAISQAIDLVPWDSLSASAKSVVGPAEESFKTVGACFACAVGWCLVRDAASAAVASADRPR